MSLFSAARKHPTQKAEETFFILNELAKTIRTDSCEETADAIISSPFWGGKIREIKLVEDRGIEYYQLLQLIKLNFPRIYNFGFYGYFSQSSFFQGHSFIVIQYSPDKNGQTFFKVVQSYINKWHVSDDLQKFEFDYLSRDQLIAQIIEPFFNLLKNKCWNADDQRDFLKITRRTATDLGDWIPSYDKNELRGCLSYTYENRLEDLSILKSRSLNERIAKIALVILTIAFITITTCIFIEKLAKDPA